MKRLLFLLSLILMIFSSMSLYAQTDFLQFINSVDWNSTENDFITKYSSQIQPRKHFYSEYYKTKSDYEVIGIIIGDMEWAGSVFVDSASLKLESLSFGYREEVKSNNVLNTAKNLSEEMDSHLIPIFGEPDQREEQLDNEYVNRLDRTWYKDNYIVDVSHMIFSESHIYTLSVKGIENKETDFRVAKWGDSKKVIMEKEGKTNLSPIEDLYLFNDIVAGISCEVAYIFTNDKLAMTKYLFNPTHSNKNDYIKDFRQLVNLMTEKYGNPDYNATEWRNSLYKDDPDEYGFAVSLGHLTYSAGWLGETTKITVALYGENYNISLLIQYVSEKYDGLREKNNIENIIKDL